MRITLIITLLCCLLPLAGKTQHVPGNTTASWKYEWKKVSADEFDLVITCTLQEGYHIYSTQEVKDQIPIATTITFEKSAGYQTEGGISESNNRIERYDSTAEMTLLFFEKTATFTQRIKLLQDQAVVKATVNYMTCNNRMCIPPSDEIITAELKK